MLFNWKHAYNHLCFKSYSILTGEDGDQEVNSDNGSLWVEKKGDSLKL